MTQFSYDFEQAILGQCAVYDPARIDSLINPLPTQVSTVTTGGTATDGDYVITVVGEEGTFVATFTRGAGETNAQITDALATEWNTNSGGENIATMTSDAVSVNTLAFLHAGSSYTVTVSAPAPGTLVAAETVSPLGANFPMAIFVTSDDGVEARRLTTGDTAQDIWGCLVRNADLVQELALPAPSELEFLPAAAMSVMREGEVWVSPEVAVAVNDPVFVRVTATGAEVSGAVRNDADGGDAVQVAGRFKTAAAAGGLARIMLNTP